jgi:hypothetical protein
VTRIKRNPCLGWEISKIENKQVRGISFLKFYNTVKFILQIFGSAFSVHSVHLQQKYAKCTKYIGNGMWPSRRGLKTLDIKDKSMVEYFGEFGN